MKHSYEWERIVHFTPGNGWLAMTSVVTRTFGVYFCPTEMYKKRLREHCINCLFMAKQNPKLNKVFDPELLVLLKSVEDQQIKAGVVTKEHVEQRRKTAVHKDYKAEKK